MTIALEQVICQKLLVSLVGEGWAGAPPGSLDPFCQPVAGVTLFRSLANTQNPAQVRELTGRLQAAAREAGHPPLLIATDQEGGQLIAIGEGTTPFPGNLALGATRSEGLAYETGYALGQELAAMGVNVDYAPVCDVNCNPRNPVVGTRSFGEDPALVADLAAAMVRGLQAAGVAATAKHFPGHGDTASDSHYGTPMVAHTEERLRRVELVPFEAAIQAGVRLVMSAHVALPAFNGRSDLPSTLSPAVLRGLLRRDLGFSGLIASDALDMHAITQGAGLIIDVITAVSAGIDLLLMKHDPASFQNVYQGLLQATRRGLLDEGEMRASAARVLELKRWLGQFEQPSLDVVGCARHAELALEVARRSVTRVRDRDGRLPLQLPEAARLAAVMPRPGDLTPADTSSYVIPGLAQALRRFHPAVDEWIIPMDPADNQVAGLVEQISGYDLVIIGTLNAGEHPGQAALVRQLLARGVQVIPVAMRMPYDLQAYPEAPVYLCTYSILPPAMQALAEALWGQIPFSGRLPVTIPDLVL